MGTFIGHIVPGFFFMCYGGWWLFQCTRFYMKSHTRGGSAYKSRVSFSSGRICNRRIDMESLLMLIAALIGMLIELGFSTHFTYARLAVNKEQHATMYFFFGLLATVGLSAHQLDKYLPNLDNIRYVMGAMAFAVEGILFEFHLAGRDDLDTSLHVLLVYTIIACVLMTLLEMVYRQQVWFCIGRAFFTFLQGSWFWQVAFILYSPLSSHVAWNPHDHHNVMLVSCIYTWHMGALFVLVFLCLLGWGAVYKSKGQLAVGTAEANYHYSVLKEDNQEIQALHDLKNELINEEI